MLCVARQIVLAFSLALCAFTNLQAATVLPPDMASANTGLASGEHSSAVPMDEPLPPELAFKFEVSATSATQLALRWTMPRGYYLYRDRTALTLLGNGIAELGPPQWPAGPTHDDPQFGKVVVYYDQVLVPVPLRVGEAGARTVRLRARFQGCQEGSVCYPPMTREVEIELPRGDANAIATRSAIGTGLVWAVIAALLGGLALNLMPCVLPILSLKVFALMESGEGPAAARRHAIWYTTGVLVSFVMLGAIILALRGAGHALGWGFQLQQPALVAVLAFVMLAAGLSMSGVVQFGVGLAGLGGSLAQRQGRMGDFLTGALACAVASPCTAPFMGSALAYAVQAPVVLAMTVFLALGLGLSLPFLLIGLFPACARWLPRPGAWMETFKQLLAFPMYLTAVWLLWVLGKQRGVDALALALVGAVLLTLGLWWFERHRHGHPYQRVLALLFGIAALAPLYAATTTTKPAEAKVERRGSIAYSPAKLAALRRDNRPVLLDVTADWCITCKVNEQAALSGSDFDRLLEHNGAIYMVADYTNADPVIAALLARHNAVGVPLYLVFPRGGGEGRRLPAVLTADLVRQAILRAAQTSQGVERRARGAPTRSRAT